MTTTLHFKPIDTVPYEKEVLLYWEKTKHYEKGQVSVDTYGSTIGKPYHWLSIDGESINSFPTHWAECPVLVFGG